MLTPRASHKVCKGIPETFDYYNHYRNYRHYCLWPALRFAASSTATTTKIRTVCAVSINTSTTTEHAVWK